MSAPTEVTMRSTKAEIFAELQAARAAQRRARHRPLKRMDLARMLACDGATELAEWVMGRETNYACVVNDQRAADLAAAMRLYISAQKVLAA